MLCRPCKTNHGTKVRTAGLRLVVQVDCVSKKGTSRVAECLKCILLGRFADFVVVDKCGNIGRFGSKIEFRLFGKM